MRNTAYLLKEVDITGESFENFIKLSIKINDFLSVSVHHSTEYPDNENMDRKVVLEDLAYMSFETFSWFCYQVYERPLKILLFKTSDNMAGFVLEHFESLFPEKIMQVEDICFFKGSQLTFGSVTHENIAQLIDPDEEIMDIYEKYGRWDRVILTERDMEYIPDLNGII